MRCNIIGYHVNDKQRVDDFIKNHLPINSTDTDWLGYGMYFWDNKSNSQYWLKEKIKKDKAKRRTRNNYKIAKSRIYIDRLLDLTDLKTLEEFNSLWKAFVLKSGHDINSELGRKIDLLFDFHEQLRDEYDVVKVFGRYIYTPKGRFIEYDYFDSKCEPIYHIKTIYCVKNESALTDIKECDDK